MCEGLWGRAFSSPYLNDLMERFAVCDTCERARVRGASLRVCVHESVYVVNRWTDSIQRGGVLT